MATTAAIARELSAQEWLTMPDDIAIRAQLDAILSRLSTLEASMIELRTLQSREAQLCPFRDITPLNTARLGRLEDSVLNIRLEMARNSLVSGSAGGGIVAVIGGILLAVAKAMHWI